MKTKLLLSVIILFFVFTSATTEEKHPVLRLEAVKDFVQIPAGKVKVNSEIFPVKEFFISKYEVTNQQYQTFLQALKEKGHTKEAIQAAQIRSENWEKLNVPSNLAEAYHRYKGFANYPVVNISYEGAQAYCQWLTEKVNQENPTKQQVEFRLPTRQEWIRAARGETNQTYAWNSPYLRNAEGRFLCNFKKLSAEQIHFDEQKNTYEIVMHQSGPDATISGKVDSFAPNAFGVYNICGNVAEMVADKGKAVGGSFNSSGYDVRVESIQDYQDASPLVGFRPIMVIKEK